MGIVLKMNLIISLAIGALFSGALILGDQLSGSELAWMDWEWPGIVVAYLFWGAVGSSRYGGIAICWFVNAIVYAIPIFIAITAIRLISRLLRRTEAAGTGR